MKKLSLLHFLLFIMGCASLQQPSDNSYFSFELEGEEYQIYGITTENNESANILIHRKDNTLIFRVIDSNQNGELDYIMTGDIDVTEANRIYSAGIRIAQEKGQYKIKDMEREFEAQFDDHYYLVQSYQVEQGAYSNRLLVYDMNGRLIGIFWDEGSNGVINRTELGNQEPEDVQELYTRILREAANKNQIENRDSKYIIRRESSISEHRNPTE